MLVGIVAIAATLIVVALLIHPRLLRSDHWRAIGTPLASIIGSGFLVSVPILRNLSGSWAAGLMLVLLGLSYLIGAAIRHNIRHIEPLLETPRHTKSIYFIERLSHVALAFSYFVSVAYYLALFSAFLLKPFGIADDITIKLLITACLALIAGVGFYKGFAAEERLEIYAVSFKLAIIAGILAALVIYFIKVTMNGTLTIVPGHLESRNVPILLGLLIVVQGFETSRFLGKQYDAELRIKTMKQAQWLAAAIYIVFFVLMIPLYSVSSDADGVAAIVDMLTPASIVLPVLVTLGALASQSSAAIADTLGASGLVNIISGDRVKLKLTYPIIALIALIITWVTDIYALISLASRCFALYYMLQCILAAKSAFGLKQTAKAALFGALALLCAAIVIFGASVEGG